MENQELYKQAILDAKAVRETAMAAAKESLAEAFEPRIKEMLRLKLSEELEEADETMEEADKVEEMKHSKMEEADETMEEGDYNMEESTLDEILAELDAIAEEPKHKMEESLEEADEEDDEDAGDEAKADKAPAADAGAGEPSEDEKVVELTVGELKDLFRDVFAQVQGGAGADMMAGAEEEVGMEMGAEDELKELSLDEILAELEEEDATMEEAMSYKTGDEKETPGKHSIEEKKKAKMNDEEAKELEEARKAVEAMRAELQEVNLLNAKLLYVNKLLKAKPLTEAQKIKVLNAFDRATTVREAENIYKTLNESLTASKTKTALKESFGYASKPAGSAPAKPIVEVDSMVARWQQIAGISK